MNRKAYQFSVSRFLPARWVVTPGLGDEVVVLGEHGKRPELDGASGFAMQPGDDVGEAVHAVELAGDDRVTRNAVHDVGPDVVENRAARSSVPSTWSGSTRVRWTTPISSPLRASPT